MKNSDMPTTSHAESEAQEPSRAEAQEETMIDKVEASIKGEDAPMEDKHPTAPFALVWYAYPLALIVFMFIEFAVIAYFWKE